MTPDNIASQLTTETMAFIAFSGLLAAVFWIVRSYFVYLRKWRDDQEEWRKEQEKWQNKFNDKMYELLLKLEKEYASKKSLDILFELQRRTTERLTHIEAILEVPRDLLNINPIKVYKYKDGLVDK